MRNTESLRKWKQVSTVEEAQTLIDLGIILDQNDAKRVFKVLNADEQLEVLKHFAERFAEARETKLAEELLIESLLVFLMCCSDEKPLKYFLDVLLVQPGRAEVCFHIVESALTTELIANDEEDKSFGIAVSLVCELGLALKALNAKYPGQVDQYGAIMDHIATYLQSVSNSNNTCIRLSLLNYFGQTEKNMVEKSGFNKVIGRFGHTVLDHLFSLLFNKKTEAVALQYLIENLPNILEADRHAQRITHETFKFYMLKKPERFALFLRTFSTHLQSLDQDETHQSRRVFFQHLGALLRVVSEVNHKPLIQNILTCFSLFDGLERMEILDELMQLPDLRKNIRELLLAMKNSEDCSKLIESANRFSSTNKRGRKPSFSRVEGWVTINQINFLGTQQIIAKAS